MQHYNSVFHDLLKNVPWTVFDQIVSRHKGDYRSRRLNSKTHFISMLYGQLSGANSLREIVAGMEIHRNRLYHLGAKPVQRSTLADANSTRSSTIFSDLFAHMIQHLNRGLRRKMVDAAYLIDSTSIKLSGTGSDWAHFSYKACGAKAHIVYDAAEDYPVYAAVTPANVNDITAAKSMPIEQGATYVFDLGYYDYAWWHELDCAGCRIVTRFKKNTPLDVTAELPVPQKTNILSDRIGLLPKRRSLGRDNPFTDPVREVCVRADNGQILRLFCNDLDAPAEEIADLYKRRWTIELFFRWVKQNLKIRHCLGNSENAVRIQIAVALIAFLLLKLAQQAQNTIKSPLTFTRLVRANLMHRKRIDRLLEQVHRRPRNKNQMEFTGL